MENWRGFLNERQNQSLPSLKRASAIIWNNPDYKPVDDFKKDSKILKTILPENISQGHAGVILLEEKDNNYIRVNSFNFGSGPCPGRKSNPESKGQLEIIRQEVGLFVPGSVIRVTRNIQLKENFFDMLEDENQSNETRVIQEMLKANERSWRLKGVKQFGLVPRIDIKTAMTYAAVPSCNRLYSVIPKLEIEGSKGDNCGSYALKVAAAGLQGYMESGGKSKEAVSISNQFIGPTDMLPILSRLKWVTLAMSF